MAFKGVLKPGDHVITTDLEHNSVSGRCGPWSWPARLSLTRIVPIDGGTIDPDAIRAAFTPTDSTRLRLTHASRTCSARCSRSPDWPHRRRARRLFLVDAAQTAGVIPIDMRPSASICWRFPATRRCSARPGPGPRTVGQRANVRPGAKAAPAAIPPAKRSLRNFRTFWKAARRMCSASRAWSPACNSWRSAGPRPFIGTNPN